MPGRHLRIFSTVGILCFLTVYLYLFKFWKGFHIQGHVSPKDRADTDTHVSPSSTHSEHTPSIQVKKIPEPAPARSGSAVAAPASPPTPTSTRQASDYYFPAASVALDDILLIIKTGASTVWRRMPLHLTTTLSDSRRVQNFVVYSDLEEQLSSTVTTIDVLANETSHLKKYDPSAHEIYQDQRSPSHLNTYREHAHLPGDEPGRQESSSTSPGWFLDKYKFLPMLRHAQANWPDLKWYIYIEDDTFIFLSNLLRYLGTISPEEAPSYYGAYSGPRHQIFAQGGSGIVFSRSLMRAVFSGNNIPSLEKYGNETSAACCGDIVLGKVLRDYQVPLNEGEYGTQSFRPESPWKTGFHEMMWCEKVFSFHHIHGKDRVVLSEMERKYEDASRPILFKDIFTSLIHPHLNPPQRTNWDNLASKWVLNSRTTFAEVPSDMGPSAFQNATTTPEMCQNACRALPMCMSWRHEEANAKTCALDAMIKLGRETDLLPEGKEKVVVTSGWMVERVEALMEEKCKKDQRA